MLAITDTERSKGTPKTPEHPEPHKQLLSVYSTEEKGAEGEDQNSQEKNSGFAIYYL